MFICGSRSFSDKYEDKNGSYKSKNPTQKRSKRSKSLTKFDKTNKNPYADRGLDKFFSLLADLDDKKQKIYDQMGPDDISFIRFVYSDDSDQVKPIVVKVKNKKYNKDSCIIANSYSAVSEKSVDENREVMVKPEEQKLERRNGSFRVEELRLRRCYCFSVMLVLILLFLAIYGRSFAIVCTSIAWYLVPRVDGGSLSLSSSSSGRKLIKRRASERNILQK